MITSNLTQVQRVRLDELRQKIDELSEWNDGLAAAVYELGGNVADQTD